MDRVPVNKRNIGMVFQSYALFPHMTVSKNVAYGLEQHDVPKSEIPERVRDVLERVHMQQYADRKPGQLSGGQQQRVSIARAMANHPKLLLCDEPTSALDSLTTKSLLELLKKINEKLGVTIIIITHEIGVVNKICNRVAVINEANIIEQGSTEDVFKNPQHELTKLLLAETLGGIK